MSGIERHSRWLLLAYPRWYRADRGDEIVDTLLEGVGSERSWPAFRDSRTLVLAGFRVRAGLVQRLTARSNLTQAVLLTAVLVLANYAAQNLSFVLGEWGHTFPSMLSSWVNLVVGLTTLAVMIGTWFGPAKAVMIAAIIDAGLLAYQPPDSQISRAIMPIAALVLIAVLAFRRQRLPRSWLGLALIWYLTFELPWVLPVSGIMNDVATFGPFVILAAAIAWTAVDVRPMLAIALTLAINFGGIVIRSVSFQGRFLSGYLVSMWPWESMGAASMALVVVAVWRLRRQALL